MESKTRISKRKRSIAALGCEETSRESEITVENADVNLFSYGQASYQNKKLQLPHYRVYMTIHDNIDQAIVTLMGKPAEQLFGYSCQDLVNAASYQGGKILPEAIEKAIGQEHVFEIKINYNGEFMVRNIIFDLEISKSTANKEPMNATPEKAADRKRGMDAAATALFSSDSEKKHKRQEKESASSSSTMKDETQNKKLD